MADKYIPGVGWVTSSGSVSQNQNQTGSWQGNSYVSNGAVSSGTSAAPSVNSGSSSGASSGVSSGGSSGSRNLYAESEQMGLSGDIKNAYSSGGYQGVIDYYNKLGNTAGANEWTGYRNNYLNTGSSGYNSAAPQSAASLYQYTIGNTSYNDPYQYIRGKSIYAPFGGDMGKAAQYYMAIGDLNNAGIALNDRTTVGANGNDELHTLLLNQYYGLKDYKKRESNDTRMLQDARSAEEAAIKAATDSAVRELEHQRGEINRGAEQSGAAAYAEYMRAINRFGSQAERAAMLGSGGSGDYMQTAALNSYQGAQAQIAGNRDKLLTDISLAITQARNSGNVQLANAIAQAAAREIANNQWWYGQQQAMSNSSTNAYLDYANRQKEWDYNLSRDAINDRRYEDQTAYERAWKEKEMEMALQEARNGNLAQLANIILEAEFNRKKYITLDEAMRQAQKARDKYIAGY